MTIVTGRADKDMLQRNRSTSPGTPLVVASPIDPLYGQQGKPRTSRMREPTTPHFLPLQIVVRLREDERLEPLGGVVRCTPLQDQTILETVHVQPDAVAVFCGVAW